MITKHIHSTKTHISDLGFCLGEKQVSINGCEFEQEQLTQGSGEEVQRNILWITMINFSVLIDFQYIKIICFPVCASKDCSLFSFGRKGSNKKKKIKKRRQAGTNSEILDKQMGLLFSQVILPCRDICWCSLPFASAVFFFTCNYPLPYTFQ